MYAITLEGGIINNTVRGIIFFLQPLGDPIFCEVDRPVNSNDIIISKRIYERFERSCLLKQQIFH